MMEVAFVIGFIILIIITIYNETHRYKYNKLMSYLEQNYPGIYEDIRIKPTLGPFYAKGAYKKSIDYAKNHESLNDPVAEALLKDYANGSQGFMIFIALIILFIELSFCGLMMVGFFIDTLNSRN